MNRSRPGEVPSFRTYSADGRLTAQGSAAKDQVRPWYPDAQLVERAEEPGMRDVSDRYRKDASPGEP